MEALDQMADLGPFGGQRGQEPLDILLLTEGLTVVQGPGTHHCNTDTVTAVQGPGTHHCNTDTVTVVQGPGHSPL